MTAERKEGGGGSGLRLRWRAYDHVEKKKKRLEVINSIAVEFFRLRRDEVVGWASSYFGKRRMPIEFIDNDSKTIAIIRLRLRDFGAFKDTNIVMYVSAQKSKKRPYQAQRIVERISKLRRKLSGDVVVIVYNEKGATIGAYKLLRQELGAYIARSKHDIKRALARYFAKRVEGLRATLLSRGGRIYGPLAVLMSIFYAALRRLGVRVPESNLAELYRAIKLGEKVEAAMLEPVNVPDVGPPPSL